MHVVIAEARMSPLLILVENLKKKRGARTYLVMIRFDKDVLHVWRKLPAGPMNHPTILLQTDSTRMFLAKEATIYVSDVSERNQRSGRICLQVNKLNLPVVEV